jgi:HK97 family phage major capsid protein
LRTIDRYADELPTDAGDRLVRHVEQRDPLGIDARYLDAVGDPAYASAFVKMLRDPMTGHLRFDKHEVEAVRNVSLVEQQRAAMAVGADATGRFAAPFQLDPSIMISGTGSLNPFRQISRVETVQGYEWRGVSADQISAHYRAEATESADDSPTLAQPVVTPRRGDVFVPYSIEIEQDFATLVTELGRMMADARDNLDADKMVTGLPASNEPVGILSIGQTGALSTTQRVQSATTNAFAIADVWSVRQAVPPRFIQNASIVTSPTVGDTVYRFVGGNSTEPALMATRDGAMVGLPHYDTSAMAATTTTGSRVIVVGDFQAGHVIGDRLGMSVELVPHLLGAANRYPTGQRGLVAYWRTGAAVVVPNALRYLEIK